MTGPELAAALRRSAEVIEGLGRVSGLELEVAPGAVLKVRSSAAERQAKHRRQRGVSRESNAQSHARERDKPRNDKRDKGVTNTVTQPPSPASPLHSPPILTPDIPKESAVAPKEPGRLSARREGVTSPAAAVEQKRFPRNLAEALEMAPHRRARLILERPDLAQWLQPERWPEVEAVLDAFRQAVGNATLSFGRYDRDSGVRAAVEFFATDPPLDTGDVVRAVRAVVASPWWTKGGVRRGLSSITTEVLRRELTPADGDAATQAAASALRQAAHARRAQREGNVGPVSVGALTAALRPANGGSGS